MGGKEEGVGVEIQRRSDLVLLQERGGTALNFFWEGVGTNRIGQWIWQ